MVLLFLRFALHNFFKVGNEIQTSHITCHESLCRAYVSFNRPFVRSGHMVQNHQCWLGSCAVGLSKQCNSYQSNWMCLCFVPLRNMLTSMCDFNRIVQRAWLYPKMYNYLCRTTLQTTTSLSP